MSVSASVASAPAGQAPRRRPRLTWVTEEPTRRLLRREGYTPVPFADVQQVAARVLATRPQDRDLRPLWDWKEWFPSGGRTAVLGVRLRTADDLKVVTRFVLDPAFRTGCDLLVWANLELDLSGPAWREDPDFGFSWTLDRFRYVVERYAARRVDDGLPPLTPIEDRLLRAMREHGLRPLVQHGIGPFRVDFALPERRLAIEADGREWHDAVRDRRRDEELAALGWEVLRFSGSDIHRAADRCADTVARRHAELARVPTLTPSIDRRPSWWQRLLASLVPRRRLAAEERAHYSVEDAAIPAVAVHDVLDPEQLAAVRAGDGVTQVIAPAGSGKTRVLVERVQELLARGVPPNRVLCTTFNRAARDELRERLERAGVSALVDVHTFHSLGRHVLITEEQLPGTRVALTWGEWRKLAGEIASEDGMTFLDAPDASSAVSNFKLGQLIAPGEHPGPARTDEERAARRIYERYEAELDLRNGWDFDDLIFRAVRLLRAQPDVRRRWQQRWWCVLVDEYQDIEPAQELLVQTLAAPHDCLLVVGDEDQCIYAWRRASVERIVELDKAFPTLERVVLQRNYRSGRTIVEAADRLIQHNTIRFPKAITAALPQTGRVETCPFEGVQEEVEATVSWLREQPDHRSAAILARTAAVLREVAMACLDAEVPIQADERVLRASSAEGAVLAYLLISHEPTEATPDDVVTAFRYPNRYLPDQLAGRVLQARRRDKPFQEVIADLPRLETWRLKALQQAAPLLDKLAETADAAAAVALLRRDLLLDQHFASRDQLTPTDNDGRDALEELTRLATEEGATAMLLSRLRRRRDRLDAAQGGDGFELTTIHGAKGREWPNVALIGADDDVMPHRRALDDADDEDARRRVWEDERRLAYVAYTRAKDHLRVSWSKAPSPFHAEAQLTPNLVADNNISAAGLRRQATDWTPPNPPPARGTAGVDRPPGTSTAAKYPGTCRTCRRPIAVGDGIVRHGTAWVHDACTDSPTPAPF
jgi:superfamily I DNA/RNA helicase/very-short-patch-repair endonuclease